MGALGWADSLLINQQAFPKYMTIRVPVSHAHAQPSVTYSELDPRGPLPDNVTAFIRDADTVFLGASSSPDTDILLAPLHIETNIRRTRPGFIRVAVGRSHAHSTRLFWCVPFQLGIVSRDRACAQEID